MSPGLFKGETARLRRTRGMQPSIPLARDISDSVQHLIVWNQYFPDEQNSPYERGLPGWQLLSETNYTVRDFWIWKDTARYRRREYLKTPMP